MENANKPPNKPKCVKRAQVKRERNFSAREEEILLKLVKKYAKLVESRCTDKDNNAIRNRAWIQIGDEFNATATENHREVDALKIKYGNMKKRAKKSFAEEKKYMYGTGGGPLRKTIDGDTEKAIEEIMGIQMTGLASRLDDDALVNCETGTSSSWITEDINKDITHNNKNIVNLDNSYDELQNQTVEEKRSPPRTDLQLDDVECETSSTNWAKYNPSMLRAPVSSALKKRKIEGPTPTQYSAREETTTRERGNNPLRSNLGKWAASKQELVDLQKSTFLQEKALLMQHMKEKHQQYLAIQEREAGLKLKHMCEEHDARMSLLKSQKDSL